MAQFEDQKIKIDKLAKELPEFYDELDKWVPLWAKMTSEQKSNLLAADEGAVIAAAKDLHERLSIFFGRS